MHVVNVAEAVCELPSTFRQLFLFTGRVLGRSTIFERFMDNSHDHRDYKPRSTSHALAAPFQQSYNGAHGLGTYHTTSRGCFPY